jgi:hypothetical protein
MSDASIRLQSHGSLGFAFDREFTSHWSECDWNAYLVALAGSGLLGKAYDDLPLVGGRAVVSAVCLRLPSQPNETERS